ncbi:hypothetical protein M408DRAFT_13411 [Serendipita vermifera MAFF 305830]|uniref:Uncharacterized protein n=1 Tax=Serendipita vermifera MAFF 305830 TaxID=933852 RepID=A0A0C3AHL2_SERVB|nr:hypothetical protein M408DRAFT_13411 [Serendipita vermifera MAFF 305830]
MVKVRWILMRSEWIWMKQSVLERGEKMEPSDTQYVRRNNVLQKESNRGRLGEGEAKRIKGNGGREDGEDLRHFGAEELRCRSGGLGVRGKGERGVSGEMTAVHQGDCGVVRRKILERAENEERKVEKE